MSKIHFIENTNCKMMVKKKKNGKVGKNEISSDMIFV